MTIRHTILTLALCLGASGAMAGGWADRDTLATLEGTWASPGAEPWYGGWGTREFVFADGRWSLVFTHALDPGMTLRTFQFRTGGAYEVLAPATVEGAFDGVFREEWKRLTLLTPDAGLADAMGLGGCGLTVNLEADISEAGCAAWRPVAVCGEDHDLFAMNSGGGLHFGVRPPDNDMCTPDKRPAALLPAVERRGIAVD